MTTTTVISRRDLQSAIWKWIEERKPSGLEVFPPGYRANTKAFDAFVEWGMVTSRKPGPRNSTPTVLGHIRMDLFWSRYDSTATLGKVTLKRGPETEDEVIETLELATLPVFGVKAWEDAGTGQLSTLTGAITDSSTSLSVASAAFFPASGEVVIGAERISYASKATNTLNGLTRGLGQTTPYAHASGKEVAEDLGSEIALIYCEEAEVSPLGWDVVAERMRTLIRVPFTVAY